MQYIKRVTPILSALLFGFLTLVMSACSDVAVSESEAPLGTVRGADARLLEFNRDISGFGGLFYDDSGALNVYVQKGELGTLSSADLKSAFADLLVRPSRGALSVQSQRELNVLEGDYAFRDLLAWRAQVDRLGVSGVVLTDASERANRVRVGVKNAQAKAELQARLAEQNIPSDAVSIEEVTPFKTTKSLRSKVRPLVGGIEIEFSDYVCTLGFNAKRKGQKGFVTNSHCTDEQGGNEATRYDQGGERVGTEVADPNYGKSDDCPSGRRCRLSDSAFVRVKDVKRDTNGIAETDGQNDMDDPDLTMKDHLDIVGYESTTLVGEELDKIGRTSGWTYGTVEETCVTFDVYEEDEDTGLTLLCQDTVFAGSTMGDSGAPVFRYAGNGGEVRLRGILWGTSGGTFAFSPIDQIRKELKLSK